MAKFTAAILLVIALTVDSSEIRDNLERPDLAEQTRNGHIFVVRFVKGEPIKIFVTGKEKASIDPKKLKVAVKKTSPGIEEDLLVDNNGEYFTVQNGISKRGIEEFKVIATVQGKSEYFHFKTDNGKR